MKKTIKIQLDPKHPTVGFAKTNCEDFNAVVKAINFYAEHPNRIDLMKKTKAKNGLCSFGKRLGFVFKSIKAAFSKDFDNDKPIFTLADESDAIAYGKFAATAQATADEAKRVY